MKKVVSVSTEMFRSMFVILYLGRIFGLMPLKWKKKNMRYMISVSKNYIVYSCTIVILMVSTALYCLHQIFEVKIIYLIKMGTTTDRYVTYVDIIGILSTAMVGVFITSLKANDLVEYFHHLNMIDSLLKPKDPRKGRHKLIVVVSMTFVTSLLTFQTAIWVNLASRVASVVILAVHFVLFHISYVYIIVIELVYWNFVSTMKIQTEALNQSIAFIIHRKKNERITKVVMRQKDERNSKDHNQKPKIKNQAAAILDITKAYLHLVTARNHLYNCYGIIILIILLGNFIALMVTPYLVRALIMNTGNSIFIVAQCIWMLGHVLRLILIVEPSNGILVQIKTTYSLICKLLCLDLQREEKNLLEFFFLCLNQCKLEFSALGFVALHRGMLTTIAGAVTTYLVILFQFD